MREPSIGLSEQVIPQNFKIHHLLKPAKVQANKQETHTKPNAPETSLDAQAQMGCIKQFEKSYISARDEQHNWNCMPPERHRTTIKTETKLPHSSRDYKPRTSISQVLALYKKANYHLV